MWLGGLRGGGTLFLVEEWWLFWDDVSTSSRDSHNGKGQRDGELIRTQIRGWVQRGLARGGGWVM